MSTLNPAGVSAERRQPLIDALQQKWVANILPNPFCSTHYDPDVDDHPCHTGRTCDTCTQIWCDAGLQFCDACVTASYSSDISDAAWLTAASVLFDAGLVRVIDGEGEMGDLYDDLPSYDPHLTVTTSSAVN